MEQPDRRRAASSSNLALGYVGQLFGCIGSTIMAAILIVVAGALAVGLLFAWSDDETDSLSQDVLCLDWRKFLEHEDMDAYRRFVDNSRLYNRDTEVHAAARFVAEGRLGEDDLSKYAVDVLSYECGVLPQRMFPELEFDLRDVPASSDSLANTEPALQDQASPLDDLDCEANPIVVEVYAERGGRMADVRPEDYPHAALEALYVSTDSDHVEIVWRVSGSVPLKTESESVPWVGSGPVPLGWDSEVFRTWDAFARFDTGDGEFSVSTRLVGDDWRTQFGPIDGRYRYIEQDPMVAGSTIAVHVPRQMFPREVYSVSVGIYADGASTPDRAEGENVFDQIWSYCSNSRSNQADDRHDTGEGASGSTHANDASATPPTDTTPAANGRIDHDQEWPSAVDPSQIAPSTRIQFQAASGEHTFPWDSASLITPPPFPRCALVDFVVHHYPTDDVLDGLDSASERTGCSVQLGRWNQYDLSIRRAMLTWLGLR